MLHDDDGSKYSHWLNNSGDDGDDESTYQPTLTSRNKWSSTKKNAQVSDLVMVVEDTLVRSKWSLGRIIQAWPGRDDVVRKVEVVTKNWCYVRALTKIAPLELD